MNCLIVYHESIFKQELMDFFHEYNPTMIDHSLFTAEIAEQYDFIVLSGGPIPISKDSEVAQEKKWLLKTNKPVFGICLGHEIVGIAYGNKLSGFSRDKLSASDIELFGQKGQLLYSHQYFFSELNDHFNIISRNNTFIEAFEHKEKPFLCVQGHPEVSGQFGKFLLNHFISTYVEVQPEVLAEISHVAVAEITSSLL